MTERPTHGMFGREYSTEERDALLFIHGADGGGFWFLPELDQHTPVDEPPRGDYGNPHPSTGPLADPMFNPYDGEPY